MFNIFKKEKNNNIENTKISYVEKNDSKITDGVVKVSEGIYFEEKDMQKNKYDCNDLIDTTNNRVIQLNKRMLYENNNKQFMLLENNGEKLLKTFYSLEKKVGSFYFLINKDLEHKDDIDFRIIIDKDGDVVAKCPYSSEEYSDNTILEDGYHIRTKDFPYLKYYGKWTPYGKYKKLLEYKKNNPVNNEKISIICNNDCLYFILEKITYNEYVSPHRDEKAIWDVKTIFNIYDKDLEHISSSSEPNITLLKNNWLVYKDLKNNKYGVIDETAKTIIDFKYSNCEWFGNIACLYNTRPDLHYNIKSEDTLDNSIIIDYDGNIKNNCYAYTSKKIGLRDLERKCYLGQRSYGNYVVIQNLKNMKYNIVDLNGNFIFKFFVDMIYGLYDDIVIYNSKGEIWLKDIKNEISINTNIMSNVRVSSYYNKFWGCYYKNCTYEKNIYILQDNTIVIFKDGITFIKYIDNKLITEKYTLNDDYIINKKIAYNKTDSKKYILHLDLANKIGTIYVNDYKIKEKNVWDGKDYVKRTEYVDKFVGYYLLVNNKIIEVQKFVDNYSVNNNQITYIYIYRNSYHEILDSHGNSIIRINPEEYGLTDKCYFWEIAFVKSNIIKMSYYKLNTRKHYEKFYEILNNELQEIVDEKRIELIKNSY